MPHFVATLVWHFRSRIYGGKYRGLRSLRSLHWRISIVLPLWGNSISTIKTHWGLNERAVPNHIEHRPQANCQLLIVNFTVSPCVLMMYTPLAGTEMLVSLP